MAYYDKDGYVGEDEPVTTIFQWLAAGFLLLSIFVGAFVLLMTPILLLIYLVL